MLVLVGNRHGMLLRSPGSDMHIALLLSSAAGFFILVIGTKVQVQPTSSPVAGIASLNLRHHHPCASASKYLRKRKLVLEILAGSDQARFRSPPAHYAERSASRCDALFFTLLVAISGAS